MNLDLGGEEVALLRELLDRHLGDMYAEISHTDNPTFRSRLRAERDLLKGIRERLNA
jgi:hypothetical protein